MPHGGCVALGVQRTCCLLDVQLEVVALEFNVVYAAMDGRLFLFLHEGRLSLFIYFSVAVCGELKHTIVFVYKGYNAYCFVRLFMCLCGLLCCSRTLLCLAAAVSAANRVPDMDCA